MDKNSSEAGKFVSAVHRSVLGALLAIAGLIGLSWAFGIIHGGSLLLGVVGLAVVGIATYWISHLFVEGLRER